MPELSVFLRLSVVSILSIAAALGGCGGSESTVTIWRSLAVNQTIYTGFPEPQASVHAEARLNQAGVHTSNRRCAKDSGYFGGQPVLFLDGIYPRYVVFDIAESQLSMATAAGYHRYTHDLDFLATPFWDCAIEGY